MDTKFGDISVAIGDADVDLTGEPVNTLIILKFHDKDGRIWSAGAAMTQLRSGDEQFTLTEETGRERGILLEQIIAIEVGP